jgi:hypothetical protein
LMSHIMAITTHFGFFDSPLQLHINPKWHMQLMTSELLNPCHFTHLVTNNVQLQNLVILMIRILKCSYNNEIPCHLWPLCDI